MKSHNRDLRLKELIYMRFVEGYSDEELRQELKTPDEKVFFEAISLQSLNRSEMIESLLSCEPEVFNQVLECRERVKQILSEFVHGSAVRRNDASLFAHGNFDCVQDS